jgi:hypothetical protein
MKVIWMKLIGALIPGLWAAAAVRAGACHAVDGPAILGRDLAAADPEFSGLAPDAAIAPAPLAGVERVLRSADIAGLAREHGLPAPTRLEELCFVRKTITLSPDPLAAAIQRVLQADPKLPPARVEVVDFSRYPVPDGIIQFPRAAVGANGVWRGSVVTPEGRSTPVWARVRVSDGATGLPLALSPGPGVREVNRGDPVRVEVFSGHAVIGFDSVAETSGRKGEMVLVSSPGQGRRLLARVEGKGKVVIRK